MFWSNTYTKYIPFQNHKSKQKPKFPNGKHDFFLLGHLPFLGLPWKLHHRMLSSDAIWRHHCHLQATSREAGLRWSQASWAPIGTQGLHITHFGAKQYTWNKEPTPSAQYWNTQPLSGTLLGLLKATRVISTELVLSKHNMNKIDNLRTLIVAFPF